MHRFLSLCPQQAVPVVRVEVGRREDSAPRVDDPAEFDDEQGRGGTVGPA